MVQEDGIVRIEYILLHPFGANSLKASTDKVRSPDSGTFYKKMCIFAKNSCFKASFFCLYVGEFQHKTNADASIELVM